MVEIDLNISDYKSYVAASKNFENNRAYETISVNLQNIELLKKLTCFEVNYFSNFNEPGLVIKVYGNMLKSTMAKKSAWALLAVDMAQIINYFLSKYKKIRPVSSNWWSLYNLLLIYIYMLCQRAESKTDVIVEILAEYVLKLIDELDLDQIIKVLITFNYISSRTSRQLRMHLKSDLDTHLSKLSVAVCKCHFFPVQLLCMETLNRWLVDRNNREARVEATNTWFQGFPTAVQLFQECSFKDFLGDTRWFLNQLNEKEDYVVSVVCRRLYVGDIAVITGDESAVSYIDINTSQRCMTVVLTPSTVRRLQIASDRPITHEVMVITHDIVTLAQLHRENIQLVISVSCSSPPKLLYDECGGHIGHIGQFDSHQLTIHVSSHTDLARLDVALNKVFQQHYQNKLDAIDDVKSQVQPSPDIIPNTVMMKAFSSSEDDQKIRLSRPPRKRSGYKTAPKTGIRSPSSVSTSSLAQLRSRLSAFPSFKFTKDAIGVSVSPELSSLSEMTEPGSSLNTTTMSTALKKAKVGFQNHKVNITHSDNEGRNTYRNKMYTGEESKNDLSLAGYIYGDTAGNAIYKYDLVELLAKEPFLAQNRDNTGDKKTSTDDNNTSEAIDNTPIEPKEKILTKRLIKPKKCTVVSNSSDESNTDAIQDFVNVRRKKNTVESPGIDFDFFASLVGDNNIPDINIDPALARKINASSDSESEVGHVVQENDVIGCLNSIIDKVCQDLDICAEDDTVSKSLDNDVIEKIVNAPITENDKDVCTEIQETQCKRAEKTQKISKKGKIPRIVIKKLPTTSVNTENNNNQGDMDEIQVIPIQNERQITPEEELFKKKIVLSGNKPKPQKKKQHITKQKKKALNQNKLKFKTLENIPKDNVTPAPKATSETNEQELAEINQKTINKSPIQTVNGSPKTPPNNGRSKVTPNSNKENAYDSDDAPLITRRKRKLYSPKDDEIEQAVINYEDDVDILSNSIDKQPPQTYYQDKTPKKRQRRSSKSGNAESPRTAKNNAIFDSLKQSETAAKIFAVDKKCSKDINIYNYSSDSEDEELKQLKLNIKSRMSSSTLCSNDSLISRRGRNVKNIDYTEKNSSDDAKKKPARKSYKRKPKTPKTSIDRPLIDERMREAQQEDLNTSFVKEKRKSIDKEKSPPKIIHEMEMDIGNVENKVLDDKPANKIDSKEQNYDLIEVIAEDVNKTDSKDETHKEVTIKSETTRTKQKYKSKNQKRQTPKVEDNPKPDRKEKSESPLPDLIMENDIPNHNDLESTMLTNNFMEKCKNLLECSVETDTTHNLLSDSRVNESVYSPPQVRRDHDNDVIPERNDNNNIESDNADIITIPDYTYNNKITQNNKMSHKQDDFEIITVDESETDHKSETRREKADFIRNIKKEYNVSKPTANITIIEDELSISSESEGEKSIPTTGNSPITAHGEALEPPPNVDMLQEVFKPRNVQVEQFEKTLQNYFYELNVDFQNSNSTLNDVDSTLKAKGNDRSRFYTKHVPNSEDKSDTSNLEKTVGTLTSDTQTKRSSIEPINFDFLTQSNDENKFEQESSDESSAQSTRTVLKRKCKDIDTSSNSYCHMPTPPKTKYTTARKKKVASQSPPTKTERFTGREKIVESPSPPKIKRLTGRQKTAESHKQVLERTIPFKKVDDWLMSRSSVNSSADAFTNCVLNIMEKVDTVLRESQQESNEAIIDFLIKDREQLDSIEKQIEDKYTNLVELMRKSHQVTKNMLETYKMESTSRAREMLRKECNKKQAVVMLIREDVQSYFDEMDRNRQLD